MCSNVKSNDLTGCFLNRSTSISNHVNSQPHEFHQQSEVYGIIWLLDESDLKNLDRQELNYERIEVNVQKVGTDEFYKCWTYTQVSSV